ncbi:MAG TPA: hypothetical protein VGD79_06750 [Thermoanaerobaculia bacterium]|jgi:hypothetical protein
MSGLFRRVPSVVFAVVFAFLAIDARAGSSYLFGLSAEEIDSVMSQYYPRGYDRELVMRQMSEPFDCGNFGDLCGTVGEDYAYRMVENGWARARKGYPIEMIDRAAQQQLEDLGRRWFARVYPDGVPEKDAYWGVTATAAAATPECDDSVSASSGDFKIVHTSKRFTIGVFAFGRIKVEHFKKNFWGNFKEERADLETDGRVFVKFIGFDPVPFNIGDSKDDTKSVAATHGDGGITIVAIRFVEGCGGVQDNFVLQACSCKGILPFGF